MKKIVIPAILLGTIMIAAGFAIMPVEQAKAVHTTILANTAKPYQTECTISIALGQVANAAGNESITLATAAGGDFSVNSVWFHYDQTTAADDMDLVSFVVNAGTRIPPANVELAAASADQNAELMGMASAAGFAAQILPQTLTSTGGAAGLVINFDTVSTVEIDTIRIVVSGLAEGGVAPTSVCT